MPKKEIPDFIRQTNEAPRDDFEGLSSRQVHYLLRDFLGVGSLIKVKEALPERLTDAMPLVRLIKDLLTSLKKKELKLTAKGNLPRQTVRDMYATRLIPDDYIDEGVYTIRGEEDYTPAEIVKHLPLLLGWTKKRNGKLSLTKKGRQALELAPGEFFKRLFFGQLEKFNLAWRDGYPESGQIQYLFPYLAYLLYIRGKTPRKYTDYGRRMSKAFPSLRSEFPENLDRAVSSRLLNGFLFYYGFTDWVDTIMPDPGKDMVTVRESYYHTFLIDAAAQPEPPSDEQRYQTQLKTALFDVEMGSETHVSDEIPPEVLDRFQESIRAFHEREGDLVRIRTLLGDEPIPLPSDRMSPREVEQLTEDLLARLRDVGILTDRETDLDPVPYYFYLHDMLLEYEVIPPGDGETIMLPFAEVFLESYNPIEARTESFLLRLFDLEQPFPPEILNGEMRLENTVVEKQLALDYLNRWRSRYVEIVPLSFELIDNPRAVHPSERQTVQLFGVSYEAVDRKGKRKTFEGPGVVELITDGEDWRITGAQFPGFAF